MEKESLLAKVREMEYEFIQYWLGAIADRLPADENQEQLVQKAQAFFQYMTALDIAADRHPFMQREAAQANDTDTHAKFGALIINSHIWRLSLLEVGSAILTLELFKQLSARIDHYEMVMCRSFWESTVKWIEDRDVELDRLHDDRINLIGKMAASMAHEIRNPLTSIKGFLKLLRAGIQQQALQKADTYLDYIEHECDNILMQVTGFLSFSKRPIIEEEPVCITAKQVLDTNISLLTPRLIDENVDLILAVPEQIKMKVQKLAIQQVLSNLLNNGVDALSSLKANKRIHISSYEDAAGTYIRVSNNGPRIPPEMGRKIFTPFVTDKENGTGLGLAICKQIMMQNNGDITYTSDDQETAFLLSFRKETDG